MDLLRTSKVYVNDHGRGRIPRYARNIKESVDFMLSEQVDVEYPAQFGNNIFGAGFGINLEIDDPSKGI